MKRANEVQDSVVGETEAVYISKDVIICRTDPDRMEEHWQEYRKSGEPPFIEDAELYKNL
ncbi:MAG: hypothetical protein K8I04_05520 [Gammaproteobacteria bacterium]|nr:hypothetical protein [Gammaproteobacteria bacterium]